MHRKPLSVNNLSRYMGVIFLCGIISSPLVSAQTPKPDLPDPVKYVNKFDIVWNVAHAVVGEMGYSIELEDRKAGRIVTKPYEFITGSLTTSEIEKIAIKKEILTGSYLRARYAVDILLEIVTPTQTMVTVRTKVEALNRDIDGSEKWIPLESLGVVERRALGKISMKLMGNEAAPDAKKGFWKQNPQPVKPGAPKPTQDRTPL
jgi:hypothetical protein